MVILMRGNVYEWALLNLFFGFGNLVEQVLYHQPLEDVQLEYI